MPSCILSIVIGSPGFAVFAAQTCGNCKGESGSFRKLSCIWHGSSLSFELGSRNFITRFFSSWVYPTYGRDALELLGGSHGSIMWPSVIAVSIPASEMHCASVWSADKSWSCLHMRSSYITAPNANESILSGLKSAKSSSSYDASNSGRWHGTWACAKMPKLVENHSNNEVWNPNKHQTHLEMHMTLWILHSPLQA